MPCPSCRPFSENRDIDHSDVSAALASLLKKHAVTLQWIPSHHNVPGSEAADSLVKDGTTKEQVDRSTSHPEVKTILKVKHHSKWRHRHHVTTRPTPTTF